MHWNNLAEIPLSKTNQNVIIQTLQGEQPQYSNLMKQKQHSSMGVNVSIDTKEFDIEYKHDMIDENYKDVITSWMG